MNKFTEALLADETYANCYGQLTFTSVMKVFNPNWKPAEQYHPFNEIFDYWWQSGECYDWKASFICFLAAMSDKDLKELDFLPRKPFNS